MKIQLYMPEHRQVTNPFQDCQLIDITNLDNIPDAICKFIHLGSCCDFSPNGVELLQRVVKKLRYGGHILLEGTDLVEVSYSIANDTLLLQDAQVLLFQGRHSCSNINDMVQSLQQLNLGIIYKRLMQYKYSIRAERSHVTK